MAEKSRSGRKQAEYRLADTKIDGTLTAWPEVPPRAPKSAVEETRLALIASPGEVHRLSPKFSDVGRASRIAQAFTRARPNKLSPTATGSFDARAFFDPEEGKWRIAARYVPAEKAAAPNLRPGA
jgi:uncharacterized protein (DUF1684 family)